MAGTGSGDNGAVTISGSGLRSDEAFEVESKDSYSIRVRATDQEGAFVEQLFTITVVGVDEPPVAEDDTATVAEDAAPAAIDVLATDTDVDG